MNMPKHPYGNFTHVITTLMVCCLIYFSASTARASEEKFQVVSAPMVKNIMDSGKGMVIHVLSEIEYDLQHITGSINIPVNKLDSSLDKFPQDKDTPLVFYCMGKR